MTMPDQTTRRLLYVIFQDDRFIGFQAPIDADIHELAAKDPDTVRIEDAHGNILWPEGTRQ